MGYTIRYYDSGKEIGHYKNIFEEVPNVRKLLEKFRPVSAPCIKVFDLEEIDDIHKEMLIYNISELDYDGDYIKIDTYQRYNPESHIDIAMNVVSPVEKRLVMSVVLCGDDIESASLEGKFASAKSLTYKNGNLHGTQLLKADGSLYTLNYMHGRFLEMFMYTGSLFNFGTKLEKIETDENLIKLLNFFDREIRNSCK